MAAKDRDEVELGVLANFAGYHLRRASNAFAQGFTRAVEGTGMRQALFGIVSIVAANPGISQGEVARILGIQRANMVALINELADSRLIDRQVSADDRRAFTLNLTDAGVTMLAECVRLVARHEEETLAALSATERLRLIKLLAKVRSADR